MRGAREKFGEQKHHHEQQSKSRKSQWRLTICVGIQNRRLRFQHGKKDVLARWTVSVRDRPCMKPVNVKKIAVDRKISDVERWVKNMQR